MEQDPQLAAGDDELPTYNALAAQNGPNSRFGRWKDWVEKRAAERYAEDTPERQQARRMRGWGPDVDIEIHETPPSPPPAPLQSQPRPRLCRTQTVLSNSSTPDCDPTSAGSTSYITRGQALPPSHLKLHSFGSRFLPHSELPILTLLPLFDDTKLLIGHTDGLSVLDMRPDASSSELGSKEPRRRDIWHGDGVYQLALLEYDQYSSNGTPQGVILALVGAELPEGGSEKDNKEHHKEIRMYNLSSLASITSWATTGKDHKPLSLSRPGNLEPQQLVQKKNKPRLTIARGLKSLKPESTDGSTRGFPLVQPYDLDIPPPPPPKDPPRSTPSLPPSAPALSPPTTEPKAYVRPGSSGSDWDVVGHDDLPLLWATDYVPLASPSSRLATQSVQSFELRRCSGRGRVTARLAIVTKQSILFYESVRGERAFRFVKEFYTPIPARSARFVYQSSHEVVTRSHLPACASESLAPFHATTSFGSRGHVGYSPRRASSPGIFTASSLSTFQGEGQLSLFVVFEKKAGLIRISDSSVGEIDLWDDGGSSPKSVFRRSITSLEGLTNKDWKGTWAPPAEITVPLLPGMPSRFSLAREATATTRLYLLTRGKRTHILPSPLPMPLASQAPLKILEWGMQPTQVVPRACEGPVTAEPFLQVTALSEDGVEVQEFPLTFLYPTKGKERERNDTLVAQADVGPGGAGFLCMGGHWTEQDGRETSPLRRNGSAGMVDALGSIHEKRTREQGFYAWTQKGYNDWRVFWLGGDSDDQVPPVSP